jgi:hypothetical protein
MPRTLFVTQGEYAGRYMRLEDDVAAQALSDGWARENEQLTPEEEEAEKEKRDQVAAGAEPDETPESLTQFENPPEEPAEAAAEANGEAPTHHTRRKRRSS